LIAGSMPIRQRFREAGVTGNDVRIFSGLMDAKSIFPNGQRRHHLLFAISMTGSWTIYTWGWQFPGSEALDEARLPFVCVFGAAWDDAIVARWSANSSGCCGRRYMRFS
jgi:hypothetical protein